MGTISSTADTPHVVDLLEFLRCRIDEEVAERRALPDELAASLGLFRTACRRVVVELAAVLPQFLRNRILWCLAAPYLRPALACAGYSRALDDGKVSVTGRRAMPAVAGC